MSVQLPDIVSRIRVDTSGLDHATKAAGQFGDQARTRMSGAAKAALAAGGAFAAIKIKDFLAGAVAGAEEARKVGAQTAQVIRSTGGAAQVSAEQVGRFAESLAAKTGVDDEAIQSGQNLLLTFTKIRNEAGQGNNVFDQATQATLDMSVAMGTDMKSAAIQVGKSLNDPIRGVTALGRAGVQFTEQQREQIKTLVESGRTLDAQKIILGELRTQFAGSAEAQASASDKMRVALGNLQEKVGGALLPLVDAAAKVATAFTNLPGPVQTGILAVSGIGLATLGAVVALEKIGGVIDTVRKSTILKTAAEKTAAIASRGVAAAAKAWTAAQWLLNAALSANPIGLIIAAVALLVAGFVALWLKSERFRNAVAALGRGIARVAKAVGEFVVGALAKVGEFFTWWATLPGRIVEALAGLGKRLYRAAVDAIQGFINGIKEKAGDIVDAVKRWITDRIPNFIKKAFGIASPSKLFAKFGEALPAGMAQGIRRGIGAVHEAVGEMVPALPTLPNASAAAGMAGQVHNSRTVSVTINNPVGQTAEESIQRRMRQLAYLGVV